MAYPLTSKTALQNQLSFKSNKADCKTAYLTSYQQDALDFFEITVSKVNFKVFLQWGT